MPIPTLNTLQFIVLSTPALLIGAVLFTVTTTVSDEVQPFVVSVVITI